MNNREIVNYILSNKLTAEQVIKETIDGEIRYIFHDEIDMWDENDRIGILEFCDDEDIQPIYEIISEEQAENELDIIQTEEEIKIAEEKLKKLKELRWNTGYKIKQMKKKQEC